MDSNSNLKVRIIDVESGWIIGKFARKMCEELIRLGVDTKIVDKRDPGADINHYPLYTYIDYSGSRHVNDTMMITHVDSHAKVELIKSRLRTYGMGICMSKYTVDYLTAMGIPRQKLCYINPAHDHVIKPRKYVIGLTYKTHPDCRKRDEFLVDIAKRIDREYFKIVIMGAGWEKIIEELKTVGIETEYYPEFEYDTYVKLVPTFDFFLYFGNDEGNMGYLDALAAGVETIVTPQGFHLDARGGLSYPCEDIHDYVRTFEEIAERKKRLVRSVEDWTWENFARKHVEVWNYILKRKSLDELFQNRGMYRDGIFSVLPEEIQEGTLLANDLQNHHYGHIMKKVVSRASETMGNRQEGGKER